MISFKNKYILNKKKWFTGYGSLIAVAVVILAAWLLPIKIPYSLTAVAQIFPDNNWVVSKDGNGQIVSTQMNMVSGLIDSYSVNEFDRGESISLYLSDRIFPGSYIRKGDTLGIVHSSYVEEKLAQLEGELNNAHALLNAGMTGEKKSLIKAAQEKIDKAKLELQQQQNSFNRIEELHKKELIAEEEYENSLTQLNILKKNVAIYTAELEAVNSGEKSEYINLLKTNINSLEKEIAVLKDHYHSLALISPIDGKITNTTTGDTIMTVSGIGKKLAVIPIQLENSNYFAPNSLIHFECKGNSKAADGRIVSVSEQVTFMKDNQVIIVKALIDATDAPFKIGQFVQCSVKCKPVSILEYVLRFLRIDGITV